MLISSISPNLNNISLIYTPFTFHTKRFTSIIYFSYPSQKVANAPRFLNRNYFLRILISKISCSQLSRKNLGNLIQIFFFNSKVFWIFIIHVYIFPIYFYNNSDIFCRLHSSFNLKRINTCIDYFWNHL